MTESVKQLEAVKDHAVYAAGAFANDTWRKEAIAAVELLIKRGDDFTGDDVWQLLEGVAAHTPEPRALGAVIQAAAKDGKIFTTGEYRKSMRRESHRRPLQVWRPVQYKRHRSLFF